MRDKRKSITELQKKKKLILELFEINKQKQLEYTLREYFI